MDAKKEYLKVVKESNLEDHQYFSLLADLLRLTNAQEKQSERLKAQNDPVNDIKEFILRQRILNTVGVLCPVGYFVTTGQLLAGSGVNCSVQKFGQVMSGLGYIKDYRREDVGDKLKHFRQEKGYYIGNKDFN